MSSIKALRSGSFSNTVAGNRLERVPFKVPCSRNFRSQYFFLLDSSLWISLTRTSDLHHIIYNSFGPYVLVPMLICSIACLCRHKSEKRLRGEVTWKYKSKPNPECRLGLTDTLAGFIDHAAKNQSKGPIPAIE